MVFAIPDELADKKKALSPPPPACKSESSKLKDEDVYGDEMRTGIPSEDGFGFRQFDEKEGSHRRHAKALEKIG